MALIAGDTPPPMPLPADYRPRVVVKFSAGTRLPYTREAAGALVDAARRDWDHLVDSFPGVALVPYFSTENDAPLQLLARRSTAAAGSAPLHRYFAIDCPAGTDTDKLARVVDAWPGVDTAYVEGGPTPPPVDPDNDPLSANQGYIDAAPQGIDARWAWPYSDGGGVGFVDMEQGWTLDHEDLAAAGITIVSGVSQAYPGHGTAVLGEVVGVDNTLGCIGIAPAARARVVSQWRSAGVYNTAEAILSAAAAMDAGDVLLLEAQTRSSTAAGYVPVEVEPAVFDAIRQATDMGIVVVEAGGNGSVDLDAFANEAGQRILDRSSADFRDSGAILVGAASAGVPHRRLAFSNYGSRIDCYGWGQGIVTTGDGWMGTSTTAYTSSFGGTSGASPIVAGAALIAQGHRVLARRPRHSPSALRAILSAPDLNTASENPPVDRIGVMPNLRAVIENDRRGRTIDADRWRLVAAILFGVIQDGGGIIWKPGSGPTPVDPWGPLMTYTHDKRQMLLGLAVTELAGLLEDDTSRGDLNAAGLGLMQRSLDRMAQQR